MPIKFCFDEGGRVGSANLFQRLEPTVWQDLQPDPHRSMRSIGIRRAVRLKGSGPPETGPHLSLSLSHEEAPMACAGPERRATLALGLRPLRGDPPPVDLIRAPCAVDSNLVLQVGAPGSCSSMFFPHMLIKALGATSLLSIPETDSSVLSVHVSANLGCASCAFIQCRANLLGTLPPSFGT